MVMGRQGERPKPRPGTPGYLVLAALSPVSSARPQARGTTSTFDLNLDRHRDMLTPIHHVMKLIRLGAPARVTLDIAGRLTTPADIPVDDTRPNGLGTALERGDRKGANVSKV